MKKQSFYINNFEFIKSKDEIDLSFVPSSTKRRLSNIDKIVFSLIFKMNIDNIDEIVFASEFGEFERLNLIIDEYLKFDEVSPVQFSGSVHNFCVGNFCHIKKSNIPYSSISSDKNTISAGIIKSIISENKNILFCFADCVNDFSGLCCTISKEKISNDSIFCSISENDSEIKSNEFIDMIDFMSNKTKEFKSSLCKIERIN